MQKKFFAFLFMSMLLSLSAGAEAPPVAAPPPAAATAAPTQAEPALPTLYNYSSNEGEYSVGLPEAPSVETIWGDLGNVPYLKRHPLDGALGEVATFGLTDPDTEEILKIKVIFLKVDPDFLKKMTQEKMEATMQKEYRDQLRPDSVKFSYSGGSNPLKWAALTGLSLDKNNRSFFHAMHYLTGQKSILVIKVQSSVGNKAFRELYKQVTNSIAYHEP